MNVNEVDINELITGIIEKYCGELNLSKYDGFTVENLEEGTGAYVDYSNGKAVIKLSQKLINSIRVATCEIEEKEAVQLLIHTIHHELCHIDIYNKTEEIQKIVDKNNIIIGADAYLVITAAYFNEYLACNMSWFTLPEAARKKYFNEYLNDINISGSNYDKSSFLKFIKNSGYILGYANAKAGWYYNLRNSINDKDIQSMIIGLNKLTSELENKYPSLIVSDLYDIRDHIAYYYNLLVK